jgi:hypothetical protein
MHVDNCGRAPPAESRAAAHLSADAAMAAIASTFPDRVFLTTSSECCVCLEAFGKAAEDSAANESGQLVAQLLRELDPSVTALRCLVRP